MEMQTEMLAPEAYIKPAAPVELNALALLTIKPEEYVAQVFAPFHNKLATLKAEADTIHFEDTRMFDAPHRYVDITTTEGMAIAVKYRAALRREIRLDAEDARAARKAPILQIGKLLDSTYKAIVEEAAPYEEKFDGAIKAEEKRKADIKAAKDRAEAERKAAIQAKINAIRTTPAKLISARSGDIRLALEALALRQIVDAEFAEFVDEAQAALDVAGQELVAMFGAAQQREKAAAEAEAAEAQRLADIAAEDQRRADVAAEQQRVAAEQAAMAKKLADQQAALERAAKEQADQAEAAARAQVAALAEAERKAKAEAARVAAEAQAEIDAQLAALAQQKAAADARDAAAALAAQIEIAHGEALIDDLARDAEIAARPVPPVLVPDDLAPVALAAIPFTDAADALPVDELDPTDMEIFDMGAECGLTPKQWLERLHLFVATHGGMVEVAA